MVLLCVATSKLNGWYFAIVLPVALLLTPQDWLRRLTIAISAAQAGSLTFLKQAYIVNYLLMVLGPAAIVARQEMIVSDNPPE